MSLKLSWSPSTEEHKEIGMIPALQFVPGSPRTQAARICGFHFNLVQRDDVGLRAVDHMPIATSLLARIGRLK